MGWKQGQAYLLLHLCRHLALDNLQGHPLRRAGGLAFVADGEPALAQDLADLIHHTIPAVGTRGLDDIVGRWWRVFLVLGALELGGGLCLELVHSREPLGISIPGGQRLHVDTLHARGPGKDRGLRVRDMLLETVSSSEIGCFVSACRLFTGQYEVVSEKKGRERCATLVTPKLSLN